MKKIQLVCFLKDPDNVPGVCSNSTQNMMFEHHPQYDVRTTPAETTNRNTFTRSSPRKHLNDARAPICCYCLHVVVASNTLAYTYKKQLPACAVIAMFEHPEQSRNMFENLEHVRI